MDQSWYMVGIQPKAGGRFWPIVAFRGALLKLWLESKKYVMVRAQYNSI